MGSLTELDKDSGIASDCSSLMSLQEDDGEGVGLSLKSKIAADDFENHNTSGHAELLMQLNNAERRLNESLKENKLLNRKFLDVSDRCEAIKEDLDKAKVDLHKERSLSKNYCDDIGKLRDQITSLGIRPCVSEVKPRADAMDDSWHTGRKFSVQVSEDDVLLACTLCFRKLRIDELESHSKQCSTKIPVPTTPTLPDALLVTVTVADPTSNSFDCLFKVVTKTTIPSFCGQGFDVERSATDFAWFRGALQDACPETIVPPIVLQNDVNDNARELQRFLARLCSHKSLKFHELLRTFLCNAEQDFDDVQQSTEKRRMVRRQSTIVKRQIQQKKDQDSLLFKAQVYVNQLEEILSQLVKMIRAAPQEHHNDDLSQCFRQLADFEQNQTYLKVAAESLSRVTAKFQRVDDPEAEAISGDLDSLIDYIRTARSLLTRVESVVDTFIFWEEELKVYEEIKHDDKVGKGSEGEVTQKWAEASAQYSAAKVELENVCRVLSDELIEFDYRKEQELRQIFMEFAESKSEYFEKLQSKWYGVKLMLELDISRDKRAIDFS